MSADLLALFGVQLHLGDCLTTLRAMPDACVDSIVTDPPYGLSFMGKRWDYDVPSVEVWAECLRVLKPGGHLLAFAGTRTQHRMAVRIEDAGFEIRDLIAWVYGSGFPKSLNVANAIHDAAIGQPQGGSKPGSKNHGKFKGGCSDENEAGRGFGAGPGQFMAEAGGKAERDLVEQAQPWQGWGTALKPALEPITVARKPLVGTVAANVLAHGTGALNIDGCRVGPDGERAVSEADYLRHEQKLRDAQAGRWPANLTHDGSDEVLHAFPQASGAVSPVKGNEPSAKTKNALDQYTGRAPSDQRDGGGSAARFFYCAKASRSDRDEGLEGFEVKRGGAEQFDSRWKEGTGNLRQPTRANTHPTVKPTDLMRYLCRLVTPPGGVVLDNYMGSGSTGKAAVLEGFQFIGCEMSPEYMAIAQARILAAIPM